MTAANDQHQPREGLKKGRVVGFLLALPVYFALGMFLSAGTWAWTKGWLFLGVFLATLAVVALYLWRVNPEVVVARTGLHEGTKRWDKILLRSFLPAVSAILPIAALDDARVPYRQVPGVW